MPIATPQGTLDFKSVDKVTFVGASSNTVIDTTTGSLGVGVGVGGPTSNLHVVGNTRLEGDINMIHTSNTSSMKVNSNVVTEFPRSKKLIRYPRVALTAASGESSGYQGYYVTESSNAANDLDRTSWKAFNMTFSTADPDDTWTNDEGTNYNGTDNTYNGNINLGTGAVNGEWIKLQLPHKIRLEYMKIWLRGDTDSTRIPEDWILYGSNDNLNWTPLLSITGQGAKNENQYSVNATSVYDYFAVVVTKISGQPNYFRIVELEYFGLPEYDPDAAGMDVKVASYPNVPNTDWLEVYYDAKGLTDISSGVSDLSGNSINGVVTGATLGTDENIDIFNFDGQNDIIQGTFSGHTLSSGYTMATWIKPGDIGADDYIATFGVGSNGTSFGINFQTVEGAFRAFIWGSSTPGIVAQTNNGAVTKDKWVHVAATFISTDGTIHLYIDNKLVATGTGTTLSSISSSTPLVLGARNSAGTIERHANFKMANFRLFNRALTQDEVWQLYSYQKEYFGHGDLGMTLKAGRLGIGTSEPRALLDVQGPVRIYDTELTNPVYAEFSSNYSSAGFSDEQSVGNWRDPSNNILDFNVVTQQSSHNAFDADSAVGVRGSFTVPVEGVYVIYYAALVNRVSTSSHIYVHVNGSNANGTGINSHQNRNTVGSMWTTLTIQRVLRLNRGDKVQCYITGGFFTLNHYSFGSIYQIGA